MGLLIAVIRRFRDPSALNADGVIPFGTALCSATALLWLIN